jgi:hypothetical protein
MSQQLPAYPLFIAYMFVIAIAAMINVFANGYEAVPDLLFTHCIYP